MQTKLFRRDFTLVVIGQIISLFGNAILRFALPLYLLRETGSSTLFGVVTACSFAPMVILSMVGGVLADRVNKRNIMVGLDFSTAALIMLFYVSLGKIPTVPLFIVVLMLLYGISGTYQPAVQASVPLLVAKEKLMAGNAVINQVNTLSGLLGPVIGGVMFTLWGIDPILLLSAACFTFSAIMEIFIHIPHEKRPREVGVLRVVGMDLKESYQFVKTEKPIFFSVVFLVSIFNLVLSAAMIVGTPILITQVLGMSDTMYGFTQGALALGGVAAAVWIAVRAFARRQAMDGVLALGCMAVLPVVMAGIYFMGDDISVHSLVLYPLVLLLLAPALLLPGLLEGLPHPNARRVLAVALTVVCAVYGLWGAVLSNQAYYKLYLAYTRSEHFANRMAARIEQTEGYVPGMTVALYGYVYGYIPEGLVYFEPDDTYRFTPMAGIITELDYINFLTMPKLLTRMIGLPVEATTTWQPQTEEETAAVAAMPSYPREGSISMVGDVCVVKFGTLNP